MKDVEPIKKNKANANFWWFGILICLLPVAIMAIGIHRPFTGLHSWAEADSSLWARVHVKYGLGYTKGLCTQGLGEPPAKNPKRYLGHPQLPVLLNAGVMSVVGMNEAALRVVKIITTAAGLLLFLKILRRLSDDKTALLAGLLYAIFPITCYFGVGDFGFGGWITPVGFYGIWCYLVLTGALKDGPKPKPSHKWALAVSLFLMVQLSWTGFFYAFVIGSHYVLRCIGKRKFPEKDLLAVLVIAPVAGLVIVFGIMAAGWDWDFSRLWELYKWRSAKGEMEEFLWGSWLARLWEFMVTNYTWPILITAIVYLIFVQVMVFKSADSKDKENERQLRRFPELYLFLMPGVLLLLVFKGLVWEHEYWQLPLSPFIAIAAALGVRLLADILKKIHRRLSAAGVVFLICVFLVFCGTGTIYYYNSIAFPPAVVKLFKILNERIPPNEKLLSYEDFIITQHEAKGSFYRPEIAWYLDREIVKATSAEQVEDATNTGKFSYYLIPSHSRFAPIINQLKQRYRYEYILGGLGMTPHLIFDLNSRVLLLRSLPKAGRLGR